MVVVAGGNLTCGLSTANFSVLCWGTNRSSLTVTVPLLRILPGICTSNQSSCLCGLFPDSETLCSGSRIICNRCDGRIQPSTPPHLSSPSSLLTPPPPASSKRTSRRWLAFAIVGSIGAFSGICSILYFIWFKRRFTTQFSPPSQHLEPVHPMLLIPPPLASERVLPPPLLDHGRECSGAKDRVS